MTERKAERILIETGETTGFDENFGISDLQPVEETSSFSPNVVQIQDSPSTEAPSSEAPAKKAPVTTTTAQTQRSRKVLYIAIAIVAVIIIAVLLFFVIKGMSQKKPESPRPVRPPGFVGACSIVKEEDSDGVLTLYHNDSIIARELKKKNVEGLVYEYAEKMSIPEEFAEEKDASNFIAFIFASTSKGSTVIFRFDGCSASKTLPVASYEFGPGKIPKNKREGVEQIINKAKESGQFDCAFDTLTLDGEDQNMLTFTMLAEFDYLHRRFQVKKCDKTYESCTTVYSTEDASLKPGAKIPIYIVPSWKGVKYFSHKSPPFSSFALAVGTPIKFLRSQITDCIGRYKEEDGSITSKIL